MTTEQHHPLVNQVIQECREELDSIMCMTPDTERVPNSKVNLMVEREFHNTLSKLQSTWSVQPLPQENPDEDKKKTDLRRQAMNTAMHASLRETVKLNGQLGLQRDEGGVLEHGCPWEKPRPLSIWDHIHLFLLGLGGGLILGSWLWKN